MMPGTRRRSSRRPSGSAAFPRSCYSIPRRMGGRRSTSGRGFVMENCVEDFPRSWAPKPYADLCKTAECKGSSINDEKALCVFVHNTEDKNVDGLKALATKEEKSDTLFFYATADEGIAEQVVRLCDIKPPKGEATLVLLDL